MWDRFKRLLGNRSPATTPANPTFSPARPDLAHSSIPRRLRRTRKPRRSSFTFPPATSLATSNHAFLYLGRDVSFDLGHTASDVQSLRSLGLPEIDDGNQLAKAIGFSSPRLRWLAFHNPSVRSCHYIHFEVAKRSGGVRRLAAPRPHIAACCRWIQSEILSKIPLHPAAHGFVPGMGIVSNAQVHVGQDVVVNMDLADFFPSVTFKRVRGLFRSLGYSGQVATVLALLCTESPRRRVPDRAGDLWTAIGPRQLPQGACTSPTISNLVCRALDRRLTGLCNTLGWNYSRYADDLSFSARGEPAGRVGYLMHRVRGIVKDEYFCIQPSKTRVQRRSQRQVVTGLVVNDKAGINRETVRRLRAILHRASHEGLAAQNRDDHPDFLAWLKGMIAHVHQADQAKGTELRESLFAILRNEKA